MVSALTTIIPWAFGAVGTLIGVLGAALLWFKLHGELNNRLGIVESHPYGDLERRVSSLEAAVQVLGNKHDNLKAQLDKIDAKLDILLQRNHE